MSANFPRTSKCWFKTILNMQILLSEECFTGRTKIGKFKMTRLAPSSPHQRYSFSGEQCKYLYNSREEQRVFDSSLMLNGGWGGE